MEHYLEAFENFDEMQDELDDFAAKYRVNLDVPGLLDAFENSKDSRSRGEDLFWEILETYKAAVQMLQTLSEHQKLSDRKIATRFDEGICHPIEETLAALYRKA
jgi:hypothetical protein